MASYGTVFLSYIIVIIAVVTGVQFVCRRKPAQVNNCLTQLVKKEN